MVGGSTSAGGRRSELEMEVGQAPEQVGRQVLVAAGAGRTMRRLGDRDVRRAVEETVEGDATLGAGERCARAGVNAEAEGQMLAGVRPVDVELVWVLEEPGVSVGGAREQQHAA